MYDYQCHVLLFQSVLAESTHCTGRVFHVAKRDGPEIRTVMMLTSADVCKEVNSVSVKNKCEC